MAKNQVTSWIGIWGTADATATVTADMSTASSASKGFSIGGLDNVGCEFTWTGTPVGVLKFQVSNSSTNGYDGNWYDIVVTFNNQPAGTATGTPVDLNNLPFKFVRAVYTKGSSTGTLTAIFSGKQV
jgi:hypothetical protein